MSVTRLRLAVVTGGHPFDVLGFHALLRAVCADDIDAYPQHLEELATSPVETLTQYDAALFYFFPQDGPSDDGPPGSPRPRAAIEGLLAAGAGLVVWHHALLAYPQWRRWDEVVGCSGRQHFSYHPSQELRVVPSAGGHAISTGLEAWTMCDETYVMPEPSGTVLLETDALRSQRQLAWARQVGASRVVCLQPGHDDQCWRMPGFQQALRASIRWSARSAQRHRVQDATAHAPSR